MIRASGLKLFALVAMLPSMASAGDYETRIRPFLSKYCVSCHGPARQKADLRLDKLDPDMVRGSDTDMWQEVLDLINVNEMPPKEAKKRPTRSERQVIVDALTASLRQAMEARRSTGGRNVLRRMTAYEYNNTLRDLLHLDLKYAADLPPEGAAQEGFKNNSSVLGTSALHIEYFERIARSALEKIILAPAEQPEPYFVRVEPERAFKPRPAKPVLERRKNGRSLPESDTASQETTTVPATVPEIRSFDWSMANCPVTESWSPETVPATRSTIHSQTTEKLAEHREMAVPDTSRSFVLRCTKSRTMPLF